MTQCKVRVTDPNGWHSRNCANNATKDGLCGTHQPDYIQRQRDRADARYAEKLAKSSPHKLREIKEIVEEMGDDTKLGSEAIGQAVGVVAAYLERIQEVLDK